MKQIVRRVEKAALDGKPLAFEKPDADASQLVRRSFDLSPSVSGRSVLAEHGAAETIDTTPESVDVYSAATKLAAVYRFDLWTIKAQLAALYPDGEIPQAHLPGLAEQLEAHTSHYTVKEEEIEVALALVKPAGFNREVETLHRGNQLPHRPRESAHLVGTALRQERRRPRLPLHALQFRLRAGSRVLRADAGGTQPRAR